MGVGSACLQHFLQPITIGKEHFSHTVPCGHRSVIVSCTGFLKLPVGISHFGYSISQAIFLDPDEILLEKCSKVWYNVYH